MNDLLDHCEICESPYGNFIDFLSILTPELMDIVMQHEDAPAFWYDGITFGFQAKNARCKVCSVRHPELRVLVEFLARLQVPYSEIITLLKPYGLFLFGSNITTHLQRHMADNLVAVTIAPDRLGAGLLIPRARLDAMPHSTEDSRVIVSQCSLGLGFCRYLIHENEDTHYCDFEYRCPTKDHSEEVIDDETRPNKEPASPLGGTRANRRDQS